MSDKTVTLSKHEGVWDRDYVEDLEKDQERLMWMILHRCNPVRTREGWCLTHAGYVCLHKTDAKSWRDAIDEAREGE